LSRCVCQDGGKAKPLKKASGAKKELDDDDKAFQARGARLPPSLGSSLWRSLLAVAHTPCGCLPYVAVTAAWATLFRTCCVAAAPLEPWASTRGTTLSRCTAQAKKKEEAAALKALKEKAGQVRRGATSRLEACLRAVELW